MASFNLGRIRGDTGAKGDTGTKGDTGAKGDKGDKGDRGTDGSTPVFSVGETKTLPPSQEAYVEINTDNPVAPVLSFSIPRGADGMNASGDMAASVYDEDGIQKDIFKYADNLFSECIKLGGGRLTGALKAAESTLEDGYVRNISIKTVLPENAANGDICIIIKDEKAKTLGECSLGSIMLIEEAGKEVEYLLAAADYHKKSTVTLVRKNLAPFKHCFDTKSREEYTASEIDIILETMYPCLLSERVRKELVTVELDSTMQRHCFLLSYNELGNMEYFSTADSRIALRDNLVAAETYITRSVTSSRTVYTVKDTGAFSSASQTTSAYYRPAFVLPSDLIVANVEHNSAPAIRLPEKKCGMYIYIGGEWKECI